MPKLSAVLNDAAYNEADDTLKTFYTQNTDTKDWWLDVDEPGKLDVAGQTAFANLKTKLDGAFKDRDAAKKAIKAFETLDLTPEQIIELRDSKRPEDIQKLVEAHKTEIE